MSDAVLPTTPATSGCVKRRFLRSCFNLSPSNFINSIWLRFYNQVAKKSNHFVVKMIYNLVVMNEFGIWLRERRREAGLTQDELHKKSGVSASYISTLERNQPHSITGAQLRPEPDKVKRLAKALNQNADEALKLAGYFPDSESNLDEIVQINFDFEGLPEKEIAKVNYLKDLLENEIRKLEELKQTNKTSIPNPLEVFKTRGEITREKANEKAAPEKSKRGLKK